MVFLSSFSFAVIPRGDEKDRYDSNLVGFFCVVTTTFVCPSSKVFCFRALAWSRFFRSRTPPRALPPPPDEKGRTCGCWWCSPSSSSSSVAAVAHNTSSPFSPCVFQFTSIISLFTMSDDDVSRMMSNDSRSFPSSSSLELELELGLGGGGFFMKKNLVIFPTLFILCAISNPSMSYSPFSLSLQKYH